MSSKATAIDVMRLHPVLVAVQAQKRVRWVQRLEGVGSRWESLEGVLRAVVPFSGEVQRLPSDRPLGEAWLRISLTTGFDKWVPLMEFAELVENGGAKIAA